MYRKLSLSSNQISLTASFWYCLQIRCDDVLASYARAPTFFSKGSSFPLLCRAIVSSPPPIHFPPINTLGTDLPPVSTCIYFWISSQLESFSISRMAICSFGMLYFANTCFAFLQNGQYDLDITTTFFSWSSVSIFSLTADIFENELVFRIWYLEKIGSDILIWINESMMIRF